MYFWICFWIFNYYLKMYFKNFIQVFWIFFCDFLSDLCTLLNILTHAKKGNFLLKYTYNNSRQFILNKSNTKYLVLTDTFELPGVVPYPEDGRLATDHRRPSTFLTLAKANWFGDTFGESKGLTLAPGLWHLGKVGEVWTIMDFRWRAVAADGLRVLDKDNSFCKCKIEIST